MAEEFTKVPAKVEAIAKAFAAECGEQGRAFSECDLVDAQLLFSECRKLRPDFTARQLEAFMARQGFRRVKARRRWHFVVQDQVLPDFHQRVNGPAGDLEAIETLVEAAAEFKYLIDTQPVGKMFFPGKVKDARDSLVYREASRVLALFQGSSQPGDARQCPSILTQEARMAENALHDYQVRIFIKNHKPEIANVRARSTEEAMDKAVHLHHDFAKHPEGPNGTYMAEVIALSAETIQKTYVGIST